ncbi:hypothetical protein [Streptosporangium roseum]|uniref:Uncharacterized protein n=1 Tax=Streptosporangium roseum (strain ATCC 12428 / DSM 43021 / JCM 3005 / KCTC 9067 / NCIMB 10171 / NRRL 2505 / NI 9100) TaxID=479432 RepID=D2B484_STRRD|nr:hypothetical protein [Streptosporangium roseum]ACZ91318.1 hypothetical protein Sros_8676 [Streptosporangium roseum DSM 43021]
MTIARERQRAYQQDLLTALEIELRPHETTTVLIVDSGGQPCLEVVDRHFRTRRVYVQMAFHWFYWGDQHDERTSSLHLLKAAERIAAAAREGWREGEQGALSVNVGKIADAYRG